MSNHNSQNVTPDQYHVFLLQLHCLIIRGLYYITSHTLVNIHIVISLLCTKTPHWKCVVTVRHVSQWKETHKTAEKLKIPSQRAFSWIGVFLNNKVIGLPLHKPFNWSTHMQIDQKNLYLWKNKIASNELNTSKWIVYLFFLRSHMNQVTLCEADPVNVPGSASQSNNNNL